MFDSLKTVWDLYEEESGRDTSVLRSGCSAIDTILNGGFAVKMLTELYGKAGSGKTQLCLQLLLQVRTLERVYSNRIDDRPL